MKKIVFLYSFLALMAGFYTGLWFWWAENIRQQMAFFAVDMARQGTVIEGVFAPVTGFPGYPSTGFSGVIRSGARALHMPSLRARGWFLPATTLHIELPQGFRIHAPGQDEFSSSMDTLAFAAVIPPRLPAAFTARDLGRWREDGNAITVKSISAAKGTLTVTGEATIGLDERLQPVLKMPARVTGHDAFLIELQQRRLVEPKQAAIASMVMGALAKPGDDGINVLAADLSVQKNALYIGPIRIVDIPPLFWPE